MFYKFSHDLSRMISKFHSYNNDKNKFKNNEKIKNQLIKYKRK